MKVMGYIARLLIALVSMMRINAKAMPTNNTDCSCHNIIKALQFV